MSGGKDPEESAREQGLDLVWPQPNELFLDIDDDASFELFKSQIAIFAQFQKGSWVASMSRNGGRHVVVRIDRDIADERERLMLQAMLGSDRKRELLGLKQLVRGRDRSSCFFKTPVAWVEFGPKPPPPAPEAPHEEETF